MGEDRGERSPSTVPCESDVLWEITTSVCEACVVHARCVCLCTGLPWCFKTIIVLLEWCVCLCVCSRCMTGGIRWISER